MGNAFKLTVAENVALDFNCHWQLQSLAVALFCTAAGGAAEFLLQGLKGSEVPAFHVFVVVGFNSLWFWFGDCRDCYGRRWYSIVEPFLAQSSSRSINTAVQCVALHLSNSYSH